MTGARLFVEGEIMKKPDFRKLIKKKMAAKKLSVPMMARQVELNSQTLYNYLAGRTQLGAENLEKVFEVLGIKVN